MLLQCQWREDGGCWSQRGQEAGGPLPGTLPHPARAQDLPDSRGQTSVNRWFSSQATKPGTWFFYKAIAPPPPPPQEMAPRKGNFVLQLCRSHFSSPLLPIFWSLPCQHPIHPREERGTLAAESGGRWEACGQRQSGLAWAARGAPASLMWASGTRGAQGKPGKPNFAISLPSSAG